MTDKLNKQGVRDLSYLDKRMTRCARCGKDGWRTPPSPGQVCVFCGPASDFGKNQMPAELAAKLLAEQPAEFGVALDPQVEEFLHVLAEECAETIQRVTKILRFGLRNNPWTGKNNLEGLHAEAGDILAALDALACLGVIDPNRIHAYEQRKLDAFVTEENPARPRIRHMTDALRAKIKAWREHGSRSDR